MLRESDGLCNKSNHVKVLTQDRLLIILSSF